MEARSARPHSMDVGPTTRGSRTTRPAAGRLVQHLQRQQDDSPGRWPTRPSPAAEQDDSPGRRPTRGTVGTVTRVCGKRVCSSPAWPFGGHRVGGWRSRPGRDRGRGGWPWEEAIIVGEHNQLESRSLRRLLVSVPGHQGDGEQMLLDFHNMKDSELFE